MSKAVPLQQGNDIKGTCQLFKEWAQRKGARYFKGPTVREHIQCFCKECGVSFTHHPLVAHSFIERLVQQRNREVTEENTRVVIFYRPNLRRQSAR